MQHLTLWVGFLGVGLAARQNKLIALATATFIAEGTARQVAQGFAATVGATVSALLAWSAIDIVVIEMEVGGEIARSTRRRCRCTPTTWRPSRICHPSRSSR